MCYSCLHTRSNCGPRTQICRCRMGWFTKAAHMQNEKAQLLQLLTCRGLNWSHTIKTLHTVTDSQQKCMWTNLWILFHCFHTKCKRDQYISISASVGTAIWEWSRKCACDLADLVQGVGTWITSLGHCVSSTSVTV